MKLRTRAIRLRQRIALGTTADDGRSYWWGVHVGPAARCVFVGFVLVVDKPSEEYRDLAGNHYLYVMDEDGVERLTKLRKEPSPP